MQVSRIALTLALMFGGTAIAAIEPVTDNDRGTAADPFDLSSGVVIDSYSPVAGFSSINGMFGGAGNAELDTTLFLDGGAVDDVSFVNFHTPSPIALSSYKALFSDDVPSNRRAVKSFKLFTSTDATFSNLNLVSSAGIDSPYGTVYGTGSIAVTDTFTPVVSQYYRAEFVRTSTYGPRVIELDANVVPEPSLALLMVAAGLLIAQRARRSMPTR